MIERENVQTSSQKQDKAQARNDLAEIAKKFTCWLYHENSPAKKDPSPLNLNSDVSFTSSYADLVPPEEGFLTIGNSMDAVTLHEKLLRVTDSKNIRMFGHVLKTQKKHPSSLWVYT
uniref:Uncharacterized protein n=1 Tax=Romanomermis culicivorax TaxID=13658 RepID=A0A915HGS6_ROMCU